MATDWQQNKKIKRPFTDRYWGAFFLLISKYRLLSGIFELLSFDVNQRLHTAKFRFRSKYFTTESRVRQYISAFSEKPTENRRKRSRPHASFCARRTFFAKAAFLCSKRLQNQSACDTINRKALESKKSDRGRKPTCQTV